MLKLILIKLFYLICVLLIFSCQEQIPLKLKTGIWQGKLQLDSMVNLPFNFRILEKDSTLLLEIYNAYEVIKVNELSYRMIHCLLKCLISIRNLF